MCRSVPEQQTEPPLYLSVFDITCVTVFMVCSCFGIRAEYWNICQNPSSSLGAHSQSGDDVINFLIQNWKGVKISNLAFQWSADEVCSLSLWTADFCSSVVSSLYLGYFFLSVWKTDLLQFLWFLCLIGLGWLNSRDQSLYIQYSILFVYSIFFVLTVEPFHFSFILLLPDPYQIKINTTSRKRHHHYRKKQLDSHRNTVTWCFNTL